MLQIVETRIISVTSWYHLAFFVISIAMFGLTAGAVWVYLHAETYRPEQLSHHLSVASLGFALASVFALLVQLTIVTSLPASVMSLVVWAEFASALSLPFFFSGIVVSLALTRSPFPVGIVYGAGPLGAALGCLGALALLNMVSGPSAMLWIAALIASGALLFARSAGEDHTSDRPSVTKLFRYRRITFGSLVLLALANSMTDGVRPTIVKDTVERRETIALERWNSFSRVTVAQGQTGQPALWGASPSFSSHPIEQRYVNIDGAAGTAVYRFAGDLNEVDFLRYDVTNLAYATPGLRTGAVIGVGGGRDVLSARLFGLSEVVGVEINPIFIDLLTRTFSSYTAIARHPGVTIEVDEARSWFSRTTHSFDIIQMSLIDTWAATGAGAFTLSENGLYTVEGWRMFLRRLTAQGVFTVSRWYSSGDFSETGRMISLAMASLLAEGSPEPRRHIFVATTGNVATLVLAREPLSAAAVDALRRWTQDKGFQVLAMPGAASASGPIERILEADSAASLDAISATSFLDISAPTDSRPFFFNQLKLSSLLDPGLAERAWQPGVFGGNLVATVTLASLVLISLMLVVAVILVPLRSALSDVDGTTVFAATAYFSMIGAGFMLAEIGLLQRLGIFLGHPVYGLSVVLFGLIVSTGIGSLVSERHPLFSTARLIAWAAALGGYLALLPWLGAALFEHFEHVNVGFRQALC